MWLLVAILLLLVVFEILEVFVVKFVDEFTGLVYGGGGGDGVLKAGCSLTTKGSSRFYKSK